VRIGVVDDRVARSAREGASPSVPADVGPAYARLLLGALVAEGDTAIPWLPPTDSIRHRLAGVLDGVVPGTVVPPAEPKPADGANRSGGSTPIHGSNPADAANQGASTTPADGADPAVSKGSTPTVVPDAEPDVVVDTGPRAPVGNWLPRRKAVPSDVPVIGIVDASFFGRTRDGWRRRVSVEVKRRFCRSVDALVCDLPSTIEAVGDLLAAGRPAPRTLLARPGVDRRPDAADVTESRVRERARSGPLDVAFVGPVVRSAGVLELVTGLERLTADWRLTVAGDLSADPEYVDRIRAALVDLDLEGRVRITGDVDDETLAATLASAHAFAAPTLAGGDGVALVDALSFGLVVVASEDGPGADLLTHRRDGLLVDPTDEGEITDALAPLCHDRERLARLGAGALATARDLPTWGETATAVRAFIRDRLRG